METPKGKRNSLPFGSPTPEEDDVDYEEFGGKGNEAEAEEIVGNVKANLKKMDYKRKIFIIKGTQESLSNDDIVITHFLHPKRGQNARYIVSNKTIMEIQRLSEQPASWLIDNTVEKDGSIYMCTPIDPLFLLIPLLHLNRKKTEEHQGYFCEFTQMLSDTNQPGYAHFAKLLDTFDLSLICDVNKDLEQPLYRLNDVKVTHWLRAKVEKLRELLSQSDHLLHGIAHSATFRLSTSEKKFSEEDILRGALGFVSEYVSSERMTELAISYGVTNYGVPKLSALDQLGEKSISSKREIESPKQPTPKKPRLTLSQSKLAKTNIKGMSQMSSFFKKNE